MSQTETNEDGVPKASPAVRPVRVLLLYFSATGNTDYVARYLADRLAEGPAEIEVLPMERREPSELGYFDLLLLGFPVFEVDSPPLVREYLSELPPGQGRGAFVFCTKAALAGNAVRKNLRRLARRDYVPLGGGSVAMPGTDGLPFMGKESWAARSALSKDYDRLKAADRLVGRLGTIVAGLSTGRSPSGMGAGLPFNVTGVVDPLWRGTYRLLGGWLKRKLRVDENCTACGLCARSCPRQSIEMREDGPHFGEGCMLCMRCVHSCPREAVQIGGATVGKFRWRGPKGDFKPLKMRPR